MKRPRLSAVDHFWRSIAHRVAARPGLVTRCLTDVRASVAEQLVERYRARGEALADRLADGDPEARNRLDAMAAEALSEMRAAVRLHVRRTGRGHAWLEAIDRRWSKPDARELMDDPDLPEGMRIEILSLLDHFNTGLGSYDSFWRLLRPLCRPDRTLRLLDLASGHGGFALATARAARAHGVDVEVTASDLRREYLDLGEAIAQRDGLPVAFRVQDARDLSNLADERFDVITCTQSLHHLPPGLIAVMFESAVRLAARGVIFIDGSRSRRTGMALSLFAALRYRHGGFLHDTWITSRRFFVPEELGLLARLGPWGDGVESLWRAPGFCVLRRIREAASPSEGRSQGSPLREPPLGIPGP